MSSGEIKKITVNEKEYVLDIEKYEAIHSIKNMFSLENFQVYGLEASNINEIILDRYDTYVHASDNIIYKAWEVDDGLEFYFDYPVSIKGVIKMLKVYYRCMSDWFYFYSNKGARITDFYEEVGKNIPSGVSAILEKGRVVVLSESSLYITEPFNYRDGGISLKFIALSYFDTDILGKGIALVKIGENVYAINQKRILYFFLGKTERECLFEELDLPILDVWPESVFEVGDGRVVMVDHKKIAFFDGKTVKYVKTHLDDDLYVKFNDFCFDGTWYFIGCENQSSYYTYAYNVHTGEDVQGTYYKFLCRNKMYVYNSKDDCISLTKLERNRMISGIPSVDVKTDFGTCLDKIMTGFEIHIKGKAVLVISGDFGDKTFVLEEGCNTARCNLNSKEFRFYFKDTMKLEVIQVKVKYRTCGG